MTSLATSPDPVAELFLDHSRRKLAQMTEFLVICVSKLTEAQIWQRSAPHENAVGTIILHLIGNMRQWVMHAVAGAPDLRERDLEFNSDGQFDRAQLTELFLSAINDVTVVLTELPTARLTETVHPQGSHLSALEAIYQVVGHVQQHTGQIIVLTKQMTARDLDLTMPRPR
jgi:hypothetical protein